MLFRLDLLDRLRPYPVYLIIFSLMKHWTTTISLTLAFALGQLHSQESIQPKEADHKLVAYGKQERQVLHLWLPKTKDPAPLVLHFHGGGFVTGDIRQKTHNRTAAMCNAAGIAYADVEYRLLNQAMLHEIMDDCALALQFLRYNAEKYNLDKNRVASYGESAGASASLWLATVDDIADANAKDPVRRESSRLIAAGGFMVQATFDVVQWPKILGLPEEKTPYWRMMNSSKARFSEKRFNELRKHMDMLGNMDKNDPPMHFSPGREDKGVHSQLFVEVLKKRAKETGANLIIRSGRQSLIGFLTDKLKTRPKPGGKAVLKPFPQHWGNPPAIQTRDYRKLPGDYGYGSGTLANWIQKNLDKDASKQKLEGK